MLKAVARVATAFALVAGLAACGDGPRPVAAAAAEPARVDPQRAVVHVEGVYADRRTSASGVIIDAEQGLALTANHGIEAAPAIFVTMADGTLMRGRAIARAQCHDFAILRLSPRPKRVEPIPFADPTALRAGDAVTTLSYQLKSARTGAPALTSVRGSVVAIGVRETFTPLPPINSLVAHQSPLAPSASGSPLLDEWGRLIGINTLVAHPREGGVTGVEYALSSTYIKRRLGELRPGRNGALGGWESEHDSCHAALRNLIGAGHTGHP